MRRRHGQMRITYYDFTDLRYASYVLVGLLHNREHLGYELTITRRRPPILRDCASWDAWRSELRHVGVFGVEIGDCTIPFCVDFRDSCRPDSGYSLPLLERVSCYFKLNHNAEAIEGVPYLREHRQKIIPIPLVFPIQAGRRRDLLPRVFPNQRDGWGTKDCVRRALALADGMCLEEMRRLRGCDKDLDVFFVMRHYPEHRDYTNEFRCRIVEALASCREIRSVAGVVGAARRLPGGSMQRRRRYSLRTYLRNLARARIAVYVRGTWDCVSFKLGQYLCLGLPIVGQPIANNSEVFCRFDSFDEQFAYEEPGAIVSEVRKLLKDPDRMTRLGNANARVFDTQLAPEHVAAGILRTVTRSRPLSLP